MSALMGVNRHDARAIQHARGIVARLARDRGVPSVAVTAGVGDYTEYVRDWDRMFPGSGADAAYVTNQYYLACWSNVRLATKGRPVRPPGMPPGCVACGRCQGTGGSDKWPGWRCVQCNGAGHVVRPKSGAGAA